MNSSVTYVPVLTVTDLPDRSLAQRMPGSLHSVREIRTLELIAFPLRQT
jgi:hypothetical protein